MFQNYLDRCRMKREECQGESRVRENFLYGLIGEVKLIPRRSFTLIELIIGVSIMVILLTLLLPSLCKAKELSLSAICLSNTAQLHKIWNKRTLIPGDKARQIITKKSKTRFLTVAYEKFLRWDKTGKKTWNFCRRQPVHWWTSRLMLTGKTLT